jgi:secreted trypsin-like serine protease
MNRLFSRFSLALGFVGAAFIVTSAGRASEVADALRSLTTSRIAEEACSTRIVGGVCTTQKKWPWQVALYFRGSDGDTYFRCGGSLVAPTRVLTAAHCFEGNQGANPENWMAVDNIDKMQFGEYPRSAATSAVRRVIVHEGYRPKTHENDIAMLDLATPLSAATIEVQGASDPALEAGREATVTGWGVTHWIVQKTDGQGHSYFIDGETESPVKPSEFLSPDLQEATLPLVDMGECEREYAPLNEGVIDARNLCAGLPGGGRDSCQGDSGGPLMTQTSTGQWRQIGVVSWGHACARRGFAGIYTRTSAFGPWIQRNLSVESAPTPQPQPTPKPVDTNVPENPAELTIAFDKGDDVRVADIVSYVATAKKAGYLAIFDATPDGNLTLVYPNAASLRSPTGGMATTRLDPSRPMLVPNYRNQYRGFDVVIEEPRGQGIMMAVLSDEPLKDLPTPDAPRSFGRNDALALIGRLRDELKSRMAGARDGYEHPPWSVAMRKYAIH